MVTCFPLILIAFTSTVAPADAYMSEGMGRYLTAAVREYLHGRPTGFKGDVPLVEAKDQGISANGRLLQAWKLTSAVAYAMNDERTFINNAASPPFKWTAKADPSAVLAMSLSEKHLRLHGFNAHRDDLHASGQEALARLDDLVDGWGLSYSEIKDAARAELEVEAERWQRHRDLRKTLAELPQLFIAV